MVWATEEQLGGQDLARLQDLLLGRLAERRSGGVVGAGDGGATPARGKRNGMGDGGATGWTRSSAAAEMVVGAVAEAAVGGWRCSQGTGGDAVGEHGAIAPSDQCGAGTPS